jgi:hypothetical protein
MTMQSVIGEQDVAWNNFIFDISTPSMNFVVGAKQKEDAFFGVSSKALLYAPVTVFINLHFPSLHIGTSSGRLNNTFLYSRHLNTLFVGLLPVDPISIQPLPSFTSTSSICETNCA